MVILKVVKECPGGHFLVTDSPHAVFFCTFWLVRFRSLYRTAMPAMIVSGKNAENSGDAD